MAAYAPHPLSCSELSPESKDTRVARERYPIRDSGPGWLSLHKFACLRARSRPKLTTRIQTQLCVGCVGFVLAQAQELLSCADVGLAVNLQLREEVLLEKCMGEREPGFSEWEPGCPECEPGVSSQPSDHT